MTDLSIDEFFDVFDSFAASPTSTHVWRWEGLQSYAVDEEDESLIAYRAGTARPERSVRTDPWLARIAASTIDGKTWTRVRYVEKPHTEYTDWELVAFGESQSAGEQVLITGEQLEVTDYWLFEGHEPTDRVVVLMHYDEHGAPVRFEEVRDGDGHRRLLAGVERLADTAVPLNAYLARCRAEVTGAA